jgi:hypothetical protein
MAATALSNQWPTLVDVAKRLDPEGRIPVIAEAMNRVNPILDDMPWIEGNLLTGHRGVIRTGLPTVAWRMLNYGVAPSKSTTKQVTDACGILEAYSRMDKEVYRLNGASDQFRMSEDVAAMEAMSQEIATTLFYGNTDQYPAKFLGLAPRYSSLSAENGGNIVNCGGTGNDNTSMWLVPWSERTIHGIYPKGSQAGLEFQNLGEQTLQDTSSNTIMQVMVSHFMHKAGIHLKDWAGIVRLANIDVSDLSGAGGALYAGVDLVNKMIDGFFKCPLRLRAVGRPVWYCNPTIMAGLVKLAMSKTVSQLTIDNLREGVKIPFFWGIPIRECDALVNTEATVS